MLAYIYYILFIVCLALTVGFIAFSSWAIQFTIKHFNNIIALSVAFRKLWNGQKELIQSNLPQMHNDENDEEAMAKRLQNREDINPYDDYHDELVERKLG
jgi:hypothetical protein